MGNSRDRPESTKICKSIALDWIGLYCIRFSLRGQNGDNLSRTMASIRSKIHLLAIVVLVWFVSSIPSTQSFSSSSSSRYRDVNGSRAGRHHHPQPLTKNRRWGVALHAEPSSSPSSRRNFVQQSVVAGSAVVTAIATTSQGLLTSSTDASGTSIANAASGEGVAAATAVRAPSIDLPPMGLGAWAWGDSIFWGCTCECNF